MKPESQKPETHRNAELERLDIERGRLNLERQTVYFRYFAILGAIATFAWTAFTYFESAHLERQKISAEQASSTAVQKVAAMQPYLERQLKLFEESTQIAAFLATTTTNSLVLTEKKQRFWQLYWGELALVEHGRVESAMVKFGTALQTGANQDDLQQLSLQITYACRDELADSWNEPSWRR